MNIVRDMGPEEYKSNVLGLAKTAKTLEMPVVLTTSCDWGPNGPILPELAGMFPDEEVVRRPEVINAYRWPAFREAVEATGRKKVIIAAVTTTTCLQFPALDMVLDGYEVHGVLDVSGSESAMAREAAVATLAQSGTKIRTWFSVAAELVADWRLDEAEGWPLAAGAVREHLPAWGHLLDTNMAYATGQMETPEWFQPLPARDRA
ncbi:MAG: isochorismatase family protein [Actinomycetota bacterium]|nr:isochorismatase family protein [Actinomycetota bacterium]